MRNINNKLFNYGFELRSNFSSFFIISLVLVRMTFKISINNFNTQIIYKNGFFDFDIYFQNFVLNFENDFYFFDEKSQTKNYLSNLKLNYKLNSK